MAVDLARDHRVVAVDAPGHGAAATRRDGLSGGARALVTTGGRALYVGYSMGGRLALRAALDHPDAVAGLVLLGATAGIDDPDERQARRRADDALADRIETQGVAEFLTGWLAQPLFGDLTVAPADHSARLANDAAGLASSLRRAGTGTMDPPWWDDLAASAVPSLVVAGQQDEKFTALGRRLTAALGGPAQFVAVEGAGHAAHLQRPGAFAELVRHFAATLSDGLKTGEPRR